MYREFWQLFVKGYGRLRVGLLICAITVVASLLEGLNIGLLLPLLDTLNSSDPEGAHWVSRAMANLFDGLGIPFTLGPLLVVLGFLVFTTAGLKYLRTILTQKTRVGFITWIRSKTMENLLQSDLAYFHQEKLGVMTGTLTTQSHRAGFSVDQIVNVISSLAVIAAYLTAALIIAPVLMGIVLVTLLLVSLGAQYYIAKVRSMATEGVQRENDLQAAAIETLSGIHVVKSFLLERLRWRDFEEKAENAGDVNYRIAKNQSLITILQEIGLFALAGTIVYLGVSVLDVGITVVIALLFILYRLMPKVLGFNVSRQALIASLAIMHSVKMIMDETSDPAIVSGNRPFSKLTSGIQVKNVDFSYNDSGPVLIDADFTIESGKMTAIAGASGVGKTTVIDLILRLYDPVHGSILVDGVDLRQLDLASWRKSIGVVSQDVFLFNDTVANNIALGRPEANSDRVVDAAKQAFAHEFIRKLPLGYETIIGDRGWNLSGGQRQRIALARAIVEMPQILILDEATSALDSESEQLIHSYIKRIRGSCTIIAVAHRLSTIQEADNIVVLDDGKIVEQGSWSNLLAEGGVFANYHRLQSGR